MKNSERQATFREKMKKKGYVQTTMFIPNKYRREVTDYVKRIKFKYEDEINGRKNWKK